MSDGYKEAVMSREYWDDKFEAELESLRSRLALREITEFGELQTALEQLSKCMTDHAITIGERDAKIGEAMYLRSRLAEAEADVKAADDLRRRWEGRAYAAEALLHRSIASDFGAEDVQAVCAFLWNKDRG